MAKIMEDLLNGNNPRKTKFLGQKRPHIMQVVGPDIDAHLCRTLVAGDHVLMEVNGSRFYTAQNCQLAAEKPWEVVENTVNAQATEGQLVLSHPDVKHPYILNYAHRILMQKGQKSQPAVFVERNPNPQAKPSNYFIILQLVAFKMHETQLATLFKPDTGRNEFIDALDDDRVKLGVLEEWSKALKAGLTAEGWNYNSVLRFALRSNVATTDVAALRHGEDWETILAISDEDLLKMRDECHRLPMLMKQAEYIQHDSHSVFEK